MNNHTLKVLEYFSILERLSNFSKSVTGKRRALAHRPFSSIDEIRRNLDLASEMNDLFKFDGGLPDLEFDDLAARVESAIANGDIFEPKALLEFANFFKTVMECQKINPKYKALHEILKGLVYPEDLHNKIELSIDLSGEIKDSASPELKKIRRELAAAKSKLNIKFEQYIHSDTSSILSDKVFSIRDGRYVLPVKESEKSKFKGIIHDRSSSGATFFIEPFESVELNNRHRELETAEREEINRILRLLTEMIFRDFEVIKNDVSILTYFDFIAACSRLSSELNSTRPIFSENGKINIKNGRHPLLLLNKPSSDRANVVPLNINFNNNEKIIIITGPNTGGKTVALKTIGLLSLMAISGLYIPADENTCFILFDKIFSDIGDEQSIESSLSTYSSHLYQIKNAVEESNSKTLVLLDELGAGTDPEEGSAIGQAVIEALARKECYAVITTHQGKLKTLAGNIPGVINGSMEFDSENLRPTFRFNIGIPGSSYALEIAEKLGIGKDIIERAWSLLDRKERDLNILIAELNQKSKEISSELENAKNSRISYESLAQIYADKLDSYSKAEKENRKEHLRKMEELIKSARQELDALIESARETPKNREALREIRKNITSRLEKTRSEISEMTPVPYKEQAHGLPGEKVFIRGIDADGEVIEPADSDGRVRVRIGNVTMLTDLEQLVSRTGSPESHSTSTVKSNYNPTPGIDIDIRGMTFDEAEPVIQRYIDDACNAGFDAVTIIHGKGTGVLRKKVQDYLSQNPRVESYRLGYWNEGSTGATVVALKKDW